VLLAAPIYGEPPRLLENGQYYVSGHFPGRPNGIGFELLFEPAAGGWRLFGLSVAPVGGAMSEPAAP